LDAKVGQKKLLLTQTFLGSTGNLNSGYCRKLPAKLFDHKALVRGIKVQTVWTGNFQQLFPNPIPEEYTVIRPNRRQTVIAFSIP